MPCICYRHRAVGASSDLYGHLIQDLLKDYGNDCGDQGYHSWFRKDGSLGGGDDADNAVFAQFNSCGDEDDAYDEGGKGLELAVSERMSSVLSLGRDVTEGEDDDVAHQVGQ